MNDEFEHRWLSDLPPDWIEKRADFLCNPCRVTIDPRVLEDDLVAHYSIPQVQENGGPIIEPASDIDSAKLLVLAPTLLVSKLNPRKKTICIAEPHPEYSTLASGEFVAISSDQIDRRYAYYLWCSDKVTDRLSAIVQSATRSHQRVNPADILKLAWKWPPLNTQQRIARFLDEKTAQIDGLIEKKRALLERLAEKRQALITRAVTKGLNPDAPMKPSGIAWLGDIPEHWEVLPLRRMVLLQRGHDLPSHARDDGEVLLVSSAGVTGRHSTPISDGPGIVTGRYGTIGEFYFIDAPYWPLNTTLYSREINCYPQFGFRMLQAMSHLFVLNSLKSAVPGVDRNDILSEAVPRPSLIEQRAIAIEINCKEQELFDRVKLVEKSINLLEEYRSALITAAITGQIEGLQ